jgi:hypothetical protein
MGIMKTVKFMQWECIVEYGKFPSGDTAIQLFDIEDGDPVSTPTVFLDRANFPHIPQLESTTQVYIKDYAENVGIIEALVDAGIVERTGKRYMINNWGSTVELCTIIDSKFKK